jgi:protein-L-isoaspartate(D-aspartate) O-methyltransferase
MNSQQLIDKLVFRRTLKTREVIEAFKKIDRISFVPQNLKSEAYGDYPLPIGDGQTISQPTTVAFMLEALGVKKGNKILEIGAGSGWVTALLAGLVGENGFVYAYEINQRVGQFGLSNLSKTGYQNYSYKIEDAKECWQKNAPYDRIISGAAFSEIPKELGSLIKKDGIIVVPTQGMDIQKITKISEMKFEKEVYPGFVFVPLK